MLIFKIWLFIITLSSLCNSLEISVENPHVHPYINNDSAYLYDIHVINDSSETIIIDSIGIETDSASTRYIYLSFPYLAPLNNNLSRAGFYFIFVENQDNVYEFVPTDAFTDSLLKIYPDTTMVLEDFEFLLNSIDCIIPGENSQEPGYVKITLYFNGDSTSAELNTTIVDPCAGTSVFEKQPQIFDGESSQKFNVKGQHISRNNSRKIFTINFSGHK